MHSDALPASSPSAGSVSTCAMMIKRVYEVGPLKSPHCGGRMKIISLIERRQHKLIERMLRHCGLWEGPIRTLASPRAPPRDPDAASELKLVPDAEFLESERLEARLVGRSAQPCEFQLVLDPEYL
jgi:hypothetical protein